MNKKQFNYSVYYFINLFAASLFTVYLPLFLKQQGYSLSQISIILSSGFLVNIVSSLKVGKIIDNIINLKLFS
ncbi:MAG: hypothetical protein ACRCTA_01605, partial [Bacilli bacterium]